MAIDNNKVVSIEYNVIDVNTKDEVDGNIGGDPLEIITGLGQIIPGLESELIKLDKGDNADIEVTPENAYGDYDDKAVQVLPREQFSGIELTEGMSLYGSGENGETVQVTVKSFSDEEVHIDYNHPLAGKTLLFTVTVLDIRDATAEELSAGAVGGHTHTHSEEGGCCGGGHCDTPEEEKKEEPAKTECCGGGHCD